MKLHHILTFLLAAIIYYSCDYIESPYIEVGVNGCTIAEPTFTPRTNPVRKILIEDFTGHRCGNCPRAAEKLLDIYNNNPDRIIAVAIHSELSGYFTAPLGATGKYSYDFRTELGKSIDQKFGISSVGIPNGMVNRKKNNNTVVIPYTQWENQVNELLSIPPDMDIQIKNYFNPNDSTLCSYVYVQALSNISGSFKVVCYLIENDFINWQKDYNYPGEDIENYQHDHILRTQLSTTWGTLLADGSVSAGQTFVNGYSIKFNMEQWNPDNCYVIAFVYNENTDEVIQVEQEKVIN